MSDTRAASPEFVQGEFDGLVAAIDKDGDYRAEFLDSIGTSRTFGRRNNTGETKVEFDVVRVRPEPNAPPSNISYVLKEIITTRLAVFPPEVLSMLDESPQPAFALWKDALTKFVFCPQSKCVDVVEELTFGIDEETVVEAPVIEGYPVLGDVELDPEEDLQAQIAENEFGLRVLEVVYKNRALAPKGGSDALSEMEALLLGERPERTEECVSRMMSLVDVLR